MYRPRAKFGMAYRPYPWATAGRSKFSKRTTKNRVKVVLKKGARKGKHTVKPRFLSGCAADYILGLYNPFATFNKGLCLPDLIAIPTRKIAYTIRGQFTVGEGLLGWVALNPYVNGSAASDLGTNVNFLAPVWYTGATFINSAVNFTGFNQAGAVVTTAHGVPAYWNSSWLNTATQLGEIFNGNRNYRLVAGGIKVQAVGNMMNRQGTYVLYEDQSNAGTLRTGGSDWTQADLLQDINITRTAVRDGEVGVTFKPRMKDDMEFASDWMDRTSYGDTITAAIAQDTLVYPVLMIAVFNGSDADVYNFEVRCHYEECGRSVNDKTRSESDIYGLSVAATVINDKPSSAPPANVAAAKLRQAEAHAGGMYRSTYAYEDMTASNTARR